MLLTKSLDIRINRNSIQHYTNLGYKFKMWEYINIPIEHITRGSKCLIDVKCDNCGFERKMQYRVYCDITNELTDKYYCKSCKEGKTKITNLKKYGVENVFQNKNIKEKIKDTNLKKYGVENVMYNKNIKEKIKLTFTNKYGVENVFQNKNIKEKIKDTNLKKYGVENYTKTKEYKEKSKKTCLTKYGVEFSLQSDEIRNKIKISRIKKGNQIPDNQLSEFKKYKKSVYRETYKNLKTLFENWNGFDYYDNEYIKDNFQLNCYHKKYPTIDHKKSIFYGFKNNKSSIEIGDLSNLCLTKRFINGSKNKKTEKEYYETFKNI